jgi:hypothetical protein
MRESRWKNVRVRGEICIFIRVGKVEIDQSRSTSVMSVDEGKDTRQKSLGQPTTLH